MALLEIPGKLKPTSYEIPEGLSYDQWESIGHSLAQFGTSYQWWVGDWLKYGERCYGEKYSQGMEATGLSYATLRNMKYVASKVELSQRRDNVDWSTHAEVASLPAEEQDEVLDKAERESLSSREVRAEVQSRKPDADPHKDVRDAIDRIRSEISKLPEPEKVAEACVNMRGFDADDAYLLSQWFSKFSTAMSTADKARSGHLSVVS